jgi:hypothetical protein
MSNQLNVRTIFTDLCAAAARIKQQLPHLLATGSSGNYLRDTLAYQLCIKYKHVARDRRIKRNEKNRGADIDLLDNSDSSPKVIIELKQLYLKDLYLSKSGPRATEFMSIPTI